MIDDNDTPPNGPGIPQEPPPSGASLALENPVPWVTYSILGVCGVIFAYLNLGRGTASFEAVLDWFLPSAPRIWSGAYWALLTSAFAHADFWHFLFNMWWARDFGRLLEPTLGRARYLAFVAGAAIISTGTQLAWSNQTGIGYSGVVYALFGYALVSRHARPIYRRIINKQTIQWMLGWLVLCLVLSATDVWNIGNGAHLGGLLFGVCVGNLHVARAYLIPSRVGMALLTGLAVLSVCYMPWSTAWRIRDSISVWMDVARRADKGDPQAQYLRAEFERRGNRHDEAITWLRKASAQGYLPAMNLLAWILATDPEPRNRNGPEAVRVAESVCQKDNWKTSAYVDTLAAAYAENEQWDKAVNTQELALSKLPRLDATSKADYESRLELFRKREKVRDKPSP